MGFLPGFRFRKTIGVLPGVRINLSKSRVSTSLGGRGATVNVGADGRRMVTLGIPGTGMSYRAPLTGTMMVLSARCRDRGGAGLGLPAGAGAPGAALVAAEVVLTVLFARTT